MGISQRINSWLPDSKPVPAVPAPERSELHQRLGVVIHALAKAGPPRARAIAKIVLPHVLADLERISEDEIRTGVARAEILLRYILHGEDVASEASSPGARPVASDGESTPSTTGTRSTMDAG